MKLKIGQKVYLQKYDVSFIMHELNIVPANFMNELFKDERIFIMNNPKSDGCAFECVFEDPENVTWLMGQDWIVDYDQYRCKKPEELKAIFEETAEKVNALINDFNSKDIAYRSKHYNEDNEEIDKMTHKLDSIGAMIKYFDGKLKFTFPNHYPNPQPAKRFGFFARLFGKGTR